MKSRRAELPAAKAALTLYGPLGEAIMRANARRDEERRAAAAGSGSDDDDAVEVVRDVGGYAAYGGLRGPIHLAWGPREEDKKKTSADSPSSEQEGTPQQKKAPTAAVAALATTFRPLEQLGASAAMPLLVGCAEGSQIVDPRGAPLAEMPLAARLRTFLRHETYGRPLLVPSSSSQQKHQGERGEAGPQQALALVAPMPARGGDGLTSLGGGGPAPAVLSFSETEYDALCLDDDRFQPLSSGDPTISAFPLSSLASASVASSSGISAGGNAAMSTLLAYSQQSATSAPALTPLSMMPSPTKNNHRGGDIATFSFQESKYSFPFGYEDTSELFALAAVYGASNTTAVADRLWPSYAARGAALAEGGDARNPPTLVPPMPAAFVHACGFRYYAVARALLRARLSTLTAAAASAGSSASVTADTPLVASAAEGNGSGDGADGAASSSGPGSIVEVAVALLVSAIGQHPLLAPTGAVTAACGSQQQQQLSSPTAAGGAGQAYYYGSYEGALAFDAKADAAAPIDPSFSTSVATAAPLLPSSGSLTTPPAVAASALPSDAAGITNSNACTTVMAHKARRVYGRLAAAVAACERRCADEPTMPLFIAAMEDRATAQYERVLEGVREGVYTNGAEKEKEKEGGSSGSGSAPSLVSPSPYALAAPDLVTAEHMLLTMNTRNAKAGADRVGGYNGGYGHSTAEGASGSGGGGGANVGSKRPREEDPCHASTSLCSPTNRATVGIGGVASPTACAAPSSYTEFLSALLAKCSDPNTAAPYPPLAPAPPPIPTMLHLELEDKLEEVLLTDPLALGCACGACRAAMHIMRGRLMRVVMLRRALSRANTAMALAQRLCLDELAPVLGAASIETAVVERDSGASGGAADGAAGAAAGAGSATGASTAGAGQGRRKKE